MTAAAIALAALAVAAWRIAPPGTLRNLIILSGLMFFTAAVSPQWAFQALELMKFAAVARILGTSIFALLVLLAIRDPQQVLRVPLFQFLGEVVAVSWLMYAFSTRYSLPRPNFDFRLWKEILHESAPIGFEGALGVVLFNFDMLMLGIWRSMPEVGEYSAAYKFINFLSAFIFLYGTNLLPVTARCKGEPAALRQVSEQSFRYTLLLAIPLAAGGMMLAGDLVRFCFGPEYSAAAGALQVLVWVVPFVTCKVVFRNTLVSHGLQRSLLSCTFWAAALNVSLNLLLIRHYSYLGSAVAMVLTEGFMVLLLHRSVSRQVTRLRVLTHAWKPALASLLMMLVMAWLAPVPLPVRIVAAAAAYIVCARILRAFSLHEIIERLRVESYGAIAR